MYRLIILNRNLKKILLEKGKNILTISPESFHYADAEEINLQIKKKYNLNTNILCCLKHTRHKESADGTYVLELNCHLDNDNLKFYEFNEVLKLKKELGVDEYLDSVKARPKWQKPGYSHRLKIWLNKKLNTEISSLNQIKSNALSSVYKMEYISEKYYIKILPEIFSPELKITKYLARKYPNNIPEVLLADKDKNILITKEINGKMLYKIEGVEEWQSCLKHMQRFNLVKVGMKRSY